MTFKDNGNGTATLSGTPASGTGRQLRAHIQSDTTGWARMRQQSFTLTVNAAQSAPAINSANSATFTVGTAGSFTVTTTGAPTPSVTGTGTLPSGVTFKDNGNGTATLSGTPASGSGRYLLSHIHRQQRGGHGCQPDFTLTVNQAASNHQREQRNVHSGDGREFYGNDDRVTGIFPNGDGHAAQWRDV